MIIALNGSSRPPARLIRMRLRWVLGVATMAGLFSSLGSDFLFRDAGDDAGLFPQLAGIQGHGAAWGDVDGDGFLDL